MQAWKATLEELKNTKSHSRDVLCLGTLEAIYDNTLVKMIIPRYSPSHLISHRQIPYSNVHLNITAMKETQQSKPAPKP